MKQKRIFIIAVVVFVLAAGFYYSMTFQSEDKEELFFVEDSSSINPNVQNNNSEGEEQKQGDIQSAQDKNKEAETFDTNEICVYVCGSVRRPGVYYLSNGQRISDAVNMAGGFSKKAAKEQINLAKELTDGEKVYIPSLNEMKQTDEMEQGFSGQKSEGEQPKVNINQAEPSDLMSLPGIGESKANAIVKYREEHGFFQKTDDMKKIEGIKDGVFNKIKDLITI